jgi:hypothetical protein
MICPNCGHSYGISNGIPNMVCDTHSRWAVLRLSGATAAWGARARAMRGDTSIRIREFPEPLRSVSANALGLGEGSWSDEKQGITARCRTPGGTIEARLACTVTVVYDNEMTVITIMLKTPMTTVCEPIRA